MGPKFMTEDQTYLRERAKVSADVGPRELWSLIDQWPLYCGVANLGRYLAVADLLRSTFKVPGHVAELGSWRGANLLLMAKLLRIFHPNDSKQVHGFDSFEGLQDFALEDGEAVSHRGDYRGSVQELETMIALYNLSDDVVLHKGRIEESLPTLLEKDKALTFSFVYCDLDLYEPTKIALNCLHDRLSKGGMFVLDEWNSVDYPGETVAVREFLDSHAQSYEMQQVPNTRQPSLVLLKSTA